MTTAILKPILMGIASGCLAVGAFGFFELCAGVVKHETYMLDRILVYSMLISIGVWLIYSAYGL